MRHYFVRKKKLDMQNLHLQLLQLLEQHNLNPFTHPILYSFLTMKSASSWKPLRRGVLKNPLEHWMQLVRVIIPLVPFWLLFGNELPLMRHIMLALDGVLYLTLSRKMIQRGDLIFSSKHLINPCQNEE